MTRASNRTLAYVALGSVIVIVGLQLVIFGIWGDAGDPPGAVVAAAFVLFWGSVLTLIGVGVLALRGRRASRNRGEQAS